MANRIPYKFTPPFGSQLNRSHDLAQGLVALWLLNANGGGVAKDYARLYDGALTNGPIWTTGMNGPALAFDGSNDLVQLGSPVIPAADHTLTAWIRPTTITPFNSMLDQYGVAQAGRFEWYTNAVTGKPVYSVSGGVTPAATTAVTANVWQMIAVSRAGSGVTFYLNGNPDGTGTQGTAIYQGANTRISGLDPFSGQINNVGIWNRALLPQEIRMLYVNPFGMFLAPRRRNIAPVAAAASGFHNLVNGGLVDFGLVNGGLAAA